MVAASHSWYSEHLYKCFGRIPIPGMHGLGVLHFLGYEKHKEHSSSAVGKQSTDFLISKHPWRVVHNRCFFQDAIQTCNESFVCRIILGIIPPILLVLKPYNEAVSMAVLVTFRYITSCGSRWRGKSNLPALNAIVFTTGRALYVWFLSRRMDALCSQA